MAAVSAVQVTFAGGVVGTSFSRLWFQELLDATSRQAAVDSVRSLLSPLAASYLKADWTLQVEQKITNFDLTTGQFSGEFLAGTRPAAIVGTVASTVGYSPGVGIRISWGTGLVLSGRKVAGRTFICPLVNFVGQNGLVLAALKTTMTAPINTYISQAGARPVIWHKVYSKPTPPEKPVYLSGNAIPINVGTIPDTIASLRSRRY